MQLNDWLTLVAIIIGPIAAVCVSLNIEARRRKYEQRLIVLRMLINTRAVPSDPSWSVAINLVPVEFNDNSNIMKAWHSYMEAAKYRPTPENQRKAEETIRAKQTALIYQILCSLGINLSETDLQTESYIADGYVQRDELYLASLRALPEIAESMKKQEEILRTIYSQSAQNEL